MDSRQYKGLQIAIMGGIVEKEPCRWFVPSQTSKQRYFVRTTERGPVCSCLDFELRQKTCKHIWAVTYLDIWSNPEDFPDTDPITLERTKGKAPTKRIKSKSEIDISGVNYGIQS